AQYASLVQEVRRVQAWHCSTQLTAYAGWVRRVNTGFQDGMSHEQLSDYFEELRGYWKALLREGSPQAAQLMRSATDAQVAELFRELERKNAEFRDNMVTQPAEEVARNRAERMSKEITRWTGDLNAQQRKAIVTWSERFLPTGEDWLDNRLRWQLQLRELLEVRRDAPDFDARFEELLIYPERGWAQGLRRKVEFNERETVQMLVAVGKALNNAQRAKLATRAEWIAGEFDDLACARESAPLAQQEQSVAIEQ
ncbi:MAG: hypothetical protein JSW10_00655, partial [Pseudomonadota bacterium]